MTSSLVGSEMCIRDREKSFQHGFSNPATAGLKSVPVSCKEVADSKGEALLEWIASINGEMQNL
eukprot:2976831-Prorocentrum_lima.AAC.1